MELPVKLMKHPAKFYCSFNWWNWWNPWSNSAVALITRSVNSSTWCPPCSLQSPCWCPDSHSEGRQPWRRNTPPLNPGWAPHEHLALSPWQCRHHLTWSLPAGQSSPRRLCATGHHWGRLAPTPDLHHCRSWNDTPGFLPQSARRHNVVEDLKVTCVNYWQMRTELQLITYWGHFFSFSNYLLAWTHFFLFPFDILLKCTANGPKTPKWHCMSSKYHNNTHLNCLG